MRRWRVPGGHAPPCPLRSARPMVGLFPGPPPCSCRVGHRAVSTRGSGPGVKPVPAWGGADLTWRAEVRVDACGPGREASPLRRPAVGGSVPSATVRDPAPGPAGLPLRQDQGARQAAPPPTRPFLLSCFPAAPGRRAPWPAGRGPDLTGRAERSVRRRGPTDGPPPGTPTAPGRPAATPDGAPGTADDPLLTIDEVIAELRVSRAAFYRWRRQGAGPPAVRLPGGGVRVRRSALTAWLRRLEEQDTQERQEQDSRWTATTSGSGTSRRSAAAPGHATGSGGRSTAVSTASRSRPARWPTGSSPS